MARDIRTDWLQLATTATGIGANFLDDASSSAVAIKMMAVPIKTAVDLVALGPAASPSQATLVLAERVPSVLSALSSPSYACAAAVGELAFNGIARTALLATTPLLTGLLLLTRQVAFTQALFTVLDRCFSDEPATATLLGAASDPVFNLVPRGEADLAERYLVLPLPPVLARGAAPSAPASVRPPNRPFDSNRDSRRDGADRIDMPRDATPRDVPDRPRPSDSRPEPSRPEPSRPERPREPVDRLDQIRDLPGPIRY